MLYLRAKAKVNLFLHITSRLSNGYHSLQSLVGFCHIYDVIKIRRHSHYELISDGPFAKDMGDNNTNLITKTFELFKTTFDLQGGLSIKITKNIPTGAGLGGGSSDAAMIIKAIVKLFNLTLQPAQYVDLAMKIGSDVPVCLHQKMCFMQGIGEKINLLPHTKKIPIILINPNIHASTKQIFSEFNKLNLNFSNPITIDTTHNWLSILPNTTNDLLIPATKIIPPIADILEALKITSPLYSSMSGSGSTCFGIYQNFHDVNNALSILHKKFPNYWIKASYLT